MCARVCECTECVGANCVCLDVLRLARAMGKGNRLGQGRARAKARARAKTRATAKARAI